MSHRGPSGSPSRGATRPSSEAATTVRAALAFALLAAAGAAAAQPSAPPGMTSPPPASADPAAAPSTASARGWEWGVGVAAGRRSGWWSPTATGDVGLGAALEGQVLATIGERLVLGAMLSSGLALEALAGVRFRLSPAWRLDLLADGGLTRQELSSSETYFAPTVGARAGLSWARRGGGTYVTFGLALRHSVPDRTVPLLCADGSSQCGEVEVGGGTLLGVFMTVGRARAGD